MVLNDLAVSLSEGSCEQRMEDYQGFIQVPHKHPLQGGAAFQARGRVPPTPTDPPSTLALTPTGS